MRKAYTTILSAVACVGLAVALSSAAQAQTRTLNMQSTWPASLTLQENFTYFAERVEKLSGGSLRINAMPAGQVVPAFEVLDATHKKVIDGAHSWAGYWTGKNKASILFTGGPGTFGMDMIDAMGWLHNGGGNELYQEFYREQLKLNVIVFPILPSGPQAFGWFKKPIETLADMKGMKCRQTGIAGEVWQALGFTVVNTPGGEIIPAAQRGVIDCAEWVGGVEDLRLGFHNVWKYHYSPGVHEAVTIGEVVFNLDVWNSLKPQEQEWIKSAANETFLIWWTRWQKQNAEALKELREKHGVQILQTPVEILREFLKGWDKLVAEEFGEEPVLQEGRRLSESLRRAGGADEAGVLPALLLPRQPLSSSAEVTGSRGLRGAAARPPRQPPGPASREARPVFGPLPR